MFRKEKRIKTVVETVYIIPRWLHLILIILGINFGGLFFFGRFIGGMPLWVEILSLILFMIGTGGAIRCETEPE